jgi:uncharacterized protein (TIRG00374 family)
VLRILILAAAAYALLPRLAGLRETTETVVRLRWWLPGLAVALEAASLACYGELVRSVLAIDGATPPRGPVQRAVLVGTSLGKLLPGGTLAALPAEVRILQQASVDPAVTTAASLTSGVVSSLLLVVLLPIAAALALAGGQRGGAALGILGVSAGTAVLAVLAWIGVRNASLGGRVGALVRRLGRRGPRAMRPRIEKMAAGLERAAAALRTAARDGHGMTRAACFAAGHWLFDFAVLTAIALAGTRGSPLAGLALAYVVGQLAAGLPITPGGVGVVETTMTGALVAQGMTAGPAAAVVLAWRLISHWLPIVVGLIVYLAAGKGSGSHPAEPGAPTRGHRPVGGMITAPAARILVDETGSQLRHM